MSKGCKIPMFSMIIFNPSQPNISFLYHLKTSENLFF